MNLDGSKTCEHKYAYLRSDVEAEDRIRKHYDVFFCDRCLQYRRVLRLEQWNHPDGRWIDHPRLQYA